MFTGIIETLGTITAIHTRGTSVEVHIGSDMQPFPVVIGASVAVDGVCLTLEKMNGKQMQFCAVAETLQRTTLANAASGRRVNLERALVAGGRLDGHFVYGHVDGYGTILSDRDCNGSVLRTISIPDGLACYIAEKGSVAVDGISLTVASCSFATFDVSLIPHSIEHTSMMNKKAGAPVNIEVDVIARYLQRLMTTHQSTVPGDQEPLSSLLERSGF